jgi:3-oxoacyl-[acyl-carrier-protein] synthase II
MTVMPRPAGAAAGGHIVEAGPLAENVGVEPIAITGIGITTCLGAGVRENWRKLREGTAGLGAITRFELGDYPIRLGGEAPEPAGEPRPVSWPPELRQLAAACREACTRAYGEPRFPAGEGTALVLGSSLAGSSAGDSFFASYLERGPREAEYGLLAGYYMDSHLHELAGLVGAPGPSELVSNACAAGASAIARAASLVRAGRAERALAAGYDPLSLFTFAGFGSLMALSRGVPRPFGKDRDGMLLGDGYAALVLEPLETARAAGRRPIALLAGCGESSDSHHLTHPHPDGDGAALAMRRALDAAGIGAGDIDYVNCHGTATRPNDRSEARALRAVFGERLARIPISSSKPFFGHTLGGAGAVEAVVTVLAVAGGFLPPTLNAGAVDPELGDLDLIPAGRELPIRFAMTNSFGFGGSNASLILARP